ncbi:MAG: DUF6259 domain-containing protein [Planctomycetota bacterium]
MMYWTLRLPVVIFLALSPHALAQDQADVVLENASLRLTIRKSPAPHIFQLVHKAANISVIQEPTESALFAIALRKGEAATEYLSSSAAQRTTTIIQKDGDNIRAVLSFYGIGGRNLDAEATVSCRRAELLTLWTISVTNRTGQGVAYVRFPLLQAAPSFGEPKDDFIVLPYLPGTLIRNPSENWVVSQGAWISFPGSLSAQFLAYQDLKAGIYLATQDTEGYPRRMGIWRREKAFSLAHDYDLNDSKQEQWQAPYPTVIGVTQGTWCDSADLYKQWAQKQSWCAKPLTQRMDIPQWWKDGPLVHVCEVRTYDKQHQHAGSYYPNLLEHLRFLQKQVNGPIVAMLAGWENHRRWTAGDYFPVFDQDRARQAIAEIRTAGFRPFFYLSGLFYTFANEGVNAGQIPAAEKYRDAYVIDQKTGQPEAFTLGESTEKRPWVRKSYAICVGTPFAKTFLRDVIERCHELGVDILQMDQTTNGAGHPCYSPHHGHMPGKGLYQAKDFQRLLDDMRTYGKGKSKDFVLFHEEPYEHLIPHLDGFHMREYKEKWWYRQYAGAVGIPLFTYLYHEYAIGYGGDSARSSPSDDPWNVRMHAVNLVTGKTPGLAVWSYPEQLLKSHPDPLKMLRNHCRLLKTRAKVHLMLGRMLHPYVLTVPTVTYKFWAGKGDQHKQYEFTEPAVLTSSWQSPDGGVGHLFVNVSKSRQPLTVSIDTRNAPAFNVCDVAIFSSEGEASLSPLWKDAHLPREFSKELAPHEVVFIDVQKAQ